jgi:hypothetical protein
VKVLELEKAMRSSKNYSSASMILDNELDQIKEQYAVLKVERDQLYHDLNKKQEHFHEQGENM